MPMRVEGASSLTALMRLSIQRAIQTLTTTNTVTVAMAFSTDQIVIRVAPLVRPIESSSETTGPSQPSTSAASSAQTISVARSSQALMLRLLPSDRRSRNITRRIRARSASSVQAVAYQGRGPSPAANCATMMIARPAR